MNRCARCGAVISQGWEVRIGGKNYHMVCAEEIRRQGR